MSHKLEIANVNGKREVAFVDNRTDAWHRLNNLPEEFQGQKIRAEVALKEGHLADWNVQTFPLEAVLPDGTRVPNPGKFATGRINPWTGEHEIFVGDNGKVGTSVGSTWTAVQNEDNIDVLNAIIDETGATIETAGSIDNGKNVFVTMQLPEAMTVGGTDRHDLYIAGLNSHDGTGAFTILLTPVRIVCANTQNYALHNFVNKYTIRHTKSATQKIEKARQALELGFKYFDEFEQEAERMMDAELTEAAFVEITKQLWNVDADAEQSKRGATIEQARTDQLIDLFANAATQANCRDTRWAGLQAVTEYVDHFAQTRSGERDGSIQRAGRAVFGNQSIRQNAYDLFSAKPKELTFAVSN